MRWLVGFLIVISLALLSGYIFLKGYPYQMYSGWAQGTNWNKYYSISNYRKSFLKPIPLEEVDPYQEDYPQLWREFPLRNSLIPLPVRHPLYQVLPIVELKNKDSVVRLGVSLETPNTREISRIYTVPTSLFADYSLGQDLFKLPFVRNRILKKSMDDLWKDIFSHEITIVSKSLDQMIHDLYILHIRSKFLPADAIRYGLIKNGKQAVIELSSQDPAYQVEVILTQDSGSIYSYILKTEKKSKESLRLRSKFLESVSFSPEDEAMGRILYTEFKQLNFARQVDQEGMLYLYSAWSQNPLEVNFLKEMIFFLERGRMGGRQLSILYEYAFKKYGKTFTTTRILSDHDNPEIKVQRRIEMETLEKNLEANRARLQVPAEPELSPDEKMNMYLKKAKETAPAEKNDMVIH